MLRTSQILVECGFWFSIFSKYENTHAHTHQCIWHGGDATNRSLALCCGCAKLFLLRLMVLLHCSVINIHYGSYMDLFSFLLLSPRGATFSCLFNDCGWTINNMHTSKHSRTPTRCWRPNPHSPGEDMLSSEGSRTRCWLGGGSSSSQGPCESRKLGKRHHWQHMRALLGWFLLLRQFDSKEVKKKFALLGDN